MNPKLHSTLKLLQPLGFILFALYFLLSGEVQKLNFWFNLALAVTSIGILYETWHGLENRHKNPSYNHIVFFGNVFIKGLLIGGIAAKISLGESQTGTQILATIVSIAVFWNLIVFLVRKDKKKTSSELLDDV